MNLTRLCDINKKPIDSIVETAGLIRNVEEDYFTIFSYHDHIRHYQTNLKCTHCKSVEIEVGQFAVVKGKLKLGDKLFICTDEITMITDQKASEYGVITNAHLRKPINSNTYFQKDVLSKLIMDTPEQMIDFLNQKALAEGFELVHIESITKSYIKLRCHLHSKYGKKQEINSKLPIFRCII